MIMKSIHDEGFAQFGQVLEGYDFTELLDTLREVSAKPMDAVIYVPGDDKLEALPVAKELADNYYGGMPIQIGYCNGNNTMLNCLEYHRDSEINIADNDSVLLLAKQADIVDNKIDTSKVEAFVLKKGEAVEVFATTLHYAPCSVDTNEGFRVIIVLPYGTNTDKPNITIKNEEDKKLAARNKWLLAHPDSSEAQTGAYIGITGENIDISK